MVFFNTCKSESLDISDVCEIDVINIGSTAIACLLLTFGIIYLVFNNKQRLFYFFFLFSFFFLILIHSVNRIEE